MSFEEERQFDITIVGATGFAGAIVAEYLLGRTAGEPITLALAGRDRKRLAELRDRLVASLPDAPSPELVVLDLLDPDSTDTIARASRVVLTTAGPYRRYGCNLVAACARHGTQYADLTGEVPWIARMIERHDSTARESGACIVHCCGFDSVPSDLGVLLVREQFHRRYGGTPDAIRFVLGPTRGGFSGGTIASLTGVIDEARSDRSVREILSDPDSLTPERLGSGTRAATASLTGRPRFDRVLGRWTIPFFMGAVNEKVVRRSNALAGYPLGKNPDYREVIAFGRGPLGAVLAAAVWTGIAAFSVLIAGRLTRRLLGAFVLPKPGKGPRAAVEKSGHFRVDITGVSAARRLTVTVSADRDPGYGATAIMIAECALLLLDAARTGEVRPGFQTPASAFGRVLVERLNAAGVRFGVEE
ncbi:MAG: saccharopine dehydrogenase [Spirochaetaceae bacterium]|nr:MAG: saccharopine dehydrogenase [Spirochaetaceae bacterium]